MFGKKQKTLFDYIEEHEPYHAIDYIKRPEYLPNTASVEHKNLENDVAEYWDLLHPLVMDFINSYATTYEKLASEVSGSREQKESLRRQLTFEQQNVQDLTDEIRELKKTLQSEAVVRKDLEERLRDEREALQTKFNEEKRALELIANSKVPEGSSMEDIIGKVRSGIGDSEEVKRLQKKVDEMEKRIKEERAENERIQSELSESFMEKITKYDEMVQNLKARLGEE